MPSGPDRRVLIRRVLQFNDPERQAVDEQHHVGAALVLVLDHGELVDRQPIVVGGIVEINHAGLCAAYRSVIGAVLNRHAVSHHAVKGAVASLQCRTFRAGQLAEGVLQRGGGKVWVEPCECITQSPRQQYLAIIGSLRAGHTGCDVGAVSDAPAKVLQPGEGGLLDGGFGDGTSIHQFSSLDCFASFSIATKCWGSCSLIKSNRSANTGLASLRSDGSCCGTPMVLAWE